jgi:hypothetical protein
MLRRSLFIGFAALVGAAFIFTGCEKEVVKEVRVPGDMMFIDTWVNDEVELTTALKDEKSGVIGLLPSKAIQLKNELTIPAGKHVVLFSDITGNKIAVEGMLYIGAEGSLTATSSSTVSVKGAGAITVKKGGTLVIDALASVNDGADGTALPVIGTSKVFFADTESNLSISSTNTDKVILQSVFGIFGDKGTFDISKTTGLKVGDAAKFSVSDTKRLVATADTAEDTGIDQIDIPVGLDITLSGPAAAPTANITVNGKLNITILSIAANKTFTVNGTLVFADTSKLNIPADASLALGETGKLLCGADVSKVKLSVAAAAASTTPTKAKVGDASPVYTVTTEAATGDVKTIVIGNASFAFTDNAIGGLAATAAATPAAGTLKAGAGTLLTLAGSN